MRNPADVMERAELHEEKGNYAEAERLYKKALSLKCKEVGGQAYDLVPFLYNLGMTQYVNDNFDDALISLNRVLTLLTSQQEEINAEIKEIRNLLCDLTHEAEQASVPMAANA
ncbi:MAG: tetratricopeptide repeat protein [Candidatus Melainabacteria bacterium]|uniref:Tetratricopeptide repeat protein n=1 Tax=Candidatus Obscuribacter phosphatis TaxID=1906157 RepID=A0A8J7TM81_9BACT|nr:tetratricopeptide repeat protein [Candidatus Obscuribacter phosphatis]MCA0312621.1 tetratricopeptide repeat protein [Candidatus Melainabacteria bacterium]OPZ82982.1 MAG: Tetratricopeptide repeat protein [bacterium ADurb.Bin425]